MVLIKSRHTHNTHSERSYTDVKLHSMDLTGRISPAAFSPFLFWMDKRVIREKESGFSRRNLERSVFCQASAAKTVHEALVLDGFHSTQENTKTTSTTISVYRVFLTLELSILALTGVVLLGSTVAKAGVFLCMYICGCVSVCWRNFVFTAHHIVS